DMRTQRQVERKDSVRAVAGGLWNCGKPREVKG
ncbi:unnamed protein product, partial [marine sediment metagenome]